MIPFKTWWAIEILYNLLTVYTIHTFIDLLVTHFFRIKLRWEFCFTYTANIICENLHNTQIRGIMIFATNFRPFFIEINKVGKYTVNIRVFERIPKPSNLVLHWLNIIHTYSIKYQMKTLQVYFSMSLCIQSQCPENR